MRKLLAVFLVFVLLALPCFAQLFPGDREVGQLMSDFYFAIELAIPDNVAATPTTGGSLSANTYYFMIVAVDVVGGTTTPSDEVSCVISGGNNRCALTWDAVTGAASYRIYKGTSSEGQDKYKTSSTNSFNWDNDTSATAGTVPVDPTAYLVFFDNAGTASWLTGKLTVDTLQVKGNSPTSVKYLRSSDSNGNATWTEPNYQTVQDEGSPVTQRNTLNFTGTGVACTDVSSVTTCSIDGGGGGDLDADISFPADISPSQITADQNDYNPTGLSTASTLRLSTDAVWRITGLAGGADGRLIIIHNIGSSPFLLPSEDTHSTASNRFSLTPGIIDFVVYPSAVVKLQYDSTSSRWRQFGQQSYSSVNDYSRFVDGTAWSTSTDGTWQSTVSGSSAAVTFTSTASPTLSGSTGSTSSGRAAWSLINMATWNALGSYYVYSTYARIDTLSDGTNRFTARLGFIDSVSGESTDGVFFRYTDNVNSGKWQGVCRSGGSETAVDLGTTVGAATLYRLTAVIRNAGASAEFFINDVSAGTCGSNIPTSQDFSAGALIIKSVGGTARTITWFYQRIFVLFSSL